MKFNYINILLFSLSLNILLLSSQVYNQRNHIITLHKATNTSRLLCECELYEPTNYDNDPEMKVVMQDFDRQSSQRFEEYNKRMIKNRQKCKERCDKDIQKIILKDKIEKELTEKLSTLQTDISTDDIPTCVCDKSASDKVENTCLKCGGILGTAVSGWSVLGSIGFYAFVNSNAMDAAVKAGITEVLYQLKQEYVLELLFEDKLAEFVTAETYACPNALNKAIMAAKGTVCSVGDLQRASCNYPFFDPSKIGPNIHSATTKGIEAANVAEANTWNGAFSSPAFFSNPIVISAIVVICIALILLIIYLILRYRRKKQMNKKLKYIKLLKE
ncbi:hypothetical protein PFTANZ_02362 [Plasmodium falciparum Tanzania (2000708)]|uniref:Surface antigen n=1 Tax=Plasmodium falciparum Tanzania (2000708) TaxID=1036725 RepID=A0A024W7T8_PLAFA|nr:hypothetical protein PFTANZ_02362 [Plasmodium falciparum Tanzania (2000708)]